MYIIRKNSSSEEFASAEMNGDVRWRLFQKKLQKDVLKMPFLTPGLQKFCAQRRVNGVYSSSEENYFRSK
ncbi:hypothetical protein VS868_04900 [Salinimicrobium sp. 3283s]|uniref:hypothetical protein n=1 Tax=Salinimicrobium sp. 3283s TaxID=3114359 RepID=UPI0031EEB193